MCPQKIPQNSPHQVIFVVYCFSRQKYVQNWVMLYIYIYTHIYKIYVYICIIYTIFSHTVCVSSQSHILFIYIYMTVSSFINKFILQFIQSFSYYCFHFCAIRNTVLKVYYNHFFPSNCIFFFRPDSQKLNDRVQWCDVQLLSLCVQHPFSWKQHLNFFLVRVSTGIQHTHCWNFRLCEPMHSFSHYNILSWVSALVSRSADLVQKL